MSGRLFAVTGATGHIGRRVAEDLLKRGHRVRVVGRRADALKAIGNGKAEAVAGSLEDADVAARAFKNADAVFLMIPPNYGSEDFRGYQNRLSEVMAIAVSAAKVPHAVSLSSVGAQFSSGVGPINGLHDFEARLNRLSNVNVLHLRPTFFMENFLFNLELIRTKGINGTPIRPDAAIPMIATRDIAAEAARRLEALDFKGSSVRELLGPRDYTLAAATAILGRAIGKPDLRYVQFPYDDAKKAARGAGLSANVAENMIEMYRAMNEGRFQPTEKRSAANTTPTTLEEFGKEFAAAYGTPVTQSH